MRRTVWKHGAMLDIFYNFLSPLTLETTTLMQTLSYESVRI